MWEDSGRSRYQRERRRAHAHYVVVLALIYLAPLVVEALILVAVIGTVRGWR